MVFCIEPMVCQKSSKPIVLEDKWSIVSEDGLRTSHYEHTVAIIDKKAVILTQYQE
jgi:methionyl aminopeptidase